MRLVVKGIAAIQAAMAGADEAIARGIREALDFEGEVLRQCTWGAPEAEARAILEQLKPIAVMSPSPLREVVITYAQLRRRGLSEDAALKRTLRDHGVSREAYQWFMDRRA